MLDGRMLPDLLSVADYDKVKAFFEQQGIVLPFSKLVRFNPLLITGLIDENYLDCPATNGMELVIQRRGCTIQSTERFGDRRIPSWII